MEETEDTFNDDQADSKHRSDPLGIIGWDIGGKYKITKHIGGGGFGEVYEGYNINLTEQRLVFKFFKRVQSRDKFAREAKILCLLDHPNICRVIDYLPEEGALVVPYISGRDGAHILRDDGPLPEALFLRVAHELSSALAFAHKQKVAHRDIKPGNILIDNNNHVYLIDFGIAKEVGDAATRTAYQALTPQFAAPERQAGNIKYDPFKSDIYEFGVTLFNFVTNNMPYRNPANPNIREWGGVSTKNLSSDLLRILRKATHPDPSARYDTADELVSDITNLKTIHRKPGHFKWIVPVVVIAAVAVAAFMGRDRIAEYFETKTTPPTITEEKKEPVNIVIPPVDKPARDSLKTDTIKSKPIVKPVDQAPPPKPPDTVFKITIIPADGASLTIDGNKRLPGKLYKIDRGSHAVRVIHRDYPILNKDIKITKDTTELTFNLNNEFSDVPLVDLTLAPSPQTEKHTLIFSLNGRDREFDSFPVRGLKRLAGEWEVAFSLFPTALGPGHKIPIDSCVTFPWGGGPRIMFSGGSGTIDFGKVTAEGVTSIPLMIFWTEK